jgi:DNA primase
MIDLEGVLANAGIGPLRTGSKEIGAPCPMHMARTGQADRNPSWSINRSTYAHHCFSCGYSGSLRGLLIDLTGVAPDELDHEIKKQSFFRNMEEFRARPVEEVEEDISEALPVFTDWDLVNIYRDVPQRLLDGRHLQRAAVDHYQVRWTQEKQWLMPLRSPSGSLLGAQYRQRGSVLTLPKEVAKSTTLFGFRQCCDNDYVALVESPLDAVRLYQVGVPAVSSLGAWVSREQIQLLARNFTRVYLALDNDKTGLEALNIIAPMLRKAGAAPIPWCYDNLYDEDGKPAKDPGDVADDDMLISSWERTRRFGL